MTKEKPLLSIIIPIYNEEPQLEEVLERVYRIDYAPKELILVDDFSHDGTRNILERYKYRPDTRVVFHEENRGKGFAIRTGLKSADGDIVIIQDADLEYDPEDIPSVVEPIVSGQTEVCYGSRFLGELERMAIPNRVANWMLAKSASWLFWVKITDEATAYKAFRHEVLKKIDLECEGFEFCPEVTAKVLRLGYSIQEVSVRFRARTVWEGKKIGWPDFGIAIRTLLKYRFAKLEAFTKS
ncbi:MAG: glycosyltransferase family 2 protein [Candidatus Omnitrophica bacterium]|nr:glycosyltransferase family 2 protein [Candidatus Omnitrophota bacterium]